MATSSTLKSCLRRPEELQTSEVTAPESTGHPRRVTFSNTVRQATTNVSLEDRLPSPELLQQMEVNLSDKAYRTNVIGPSLRDAWNTCGVQTRENTKINRTHESRWSAQEATAKFRQVYGEPAAVSRAPAPPQPTSSYATASGTPQVFTNNTGSVDSHDAEGSYNLALGTAVIAAVAAALFLWNRR